MRGRCSDECSFGFRTFGFSRRLNPPSSLNPTPCRVRFPNRRDAQAVNGSVAHPIGPVTMSGSPATQLFGEGEYLTYDVVADLK